MRDYKKVQDIYYTVNTMYCIVFFIDIHNIFIKGHFDSLHIQ